MRPPGRRRCTRIWLRLGLRQDEGLDGIAAAIAEGHHRAEGIVVIVVDRVTVGHLDHADRLVDARAVDVFAQEGAGAVSAVVAVFGNAAVDVLFDAPVRRSRICR